MISLFQLVITNYPTWINQTKRIYFGDEKKLSKQTSPTFPAVVPAVRQGCLPSLFEDESYSPV